MEERYGGEANASDLWSMKCLRGIQSALPRVWLEFLVWILGLPGLKV